MPPTTTHEQKSTIRNKKFGFSTPEHKQAGNAITLQYLDENQDIQNIDLSSVHMMGVNETGKITEKNIALSYGDILALAGDYYAIAKLPIANFTNAEEAKRRFITAFNTLANSNSKEISEIFKINNKNYSSNSYLNEYIKQAKFLFLLGKNYFNITNNNLDHFIPWSQKAYEIGHQVAIDMAKKAYVLRDVNFKESKKFLMLAYQMNAFACHFLSDSFSSGHLRLGELRKELSNRFGVIGGILVNNMHNEDSTLGVNVYNKLGQSWRAYGDDNYFLSKDSNNREMQATALQESATELFRVYVDGKEPRNSRVLDYLPKVDESEIAPHQQYAPMFIFKEDKKIYFRDPITELNTKIVKYSELTRFKAFLLAVKLRLFPGYFAPKYTVEQTSDRKINNIYTVFPKNICADTLTQKPEAQHDNSSLLDSRKENDKDKITVIIQDTSTESFDNDLKTRLETFK